MSVVRVVFIHCDVCQESEQSDQGTSTVAEARIDCRFMGWHRVAGRDICADCWEAGVR